MLKNYGYSCLYRAKGADISVLLENPLTYDLSPDTLVFSVTLESEHSDKSVLGLEDIKFYLMDESGRIYNTQVIPGAKVVLASDVDKEEAPRHDGLMCVEFRPDFLFQDLRLVFHVKASSEIAIIQLMH